MRAGLSDACRWAPFGSYLSGVPFFAQLNLISIWQCRKPCLIATTGHMYHVFFLFFFFIHQKRLKITLAKMN